MKKVIFALVIMAAFSTTVFAQPLPVAGSPDKLSGDFALAGPASTAFESDLFADVNAAALSREEAQAVEGDGWLSGLFRAVVTAVQVVVNVASGNYVGAAVTGVTGAYSSYAAWIDPNTP
jgi:hypothetical protein